MRTVHGTIMDAQSGNPIEGAHIQLGYAYNGAFAGAGTGTTSDANGEYHFTFTPTEETRIAVSHIGYVPRELDPNFAPLDPTRPWQIVLDPKSYPVNEVTVTANTATFDWKPFFLVMLVVGLLFLLNDEV